jgi:3-hydroxybutyryl-CoA dehydrogenase
MMIKNQAKVAVIGAGLMGHGIAQIMLAAGHCVNLFDPNEEALMAASDKIADIFSLLEQNCVLLSHLSISHSIKDAVSNADIVFEAGPEKLNVKVAIFQEVALHARNNTIFATNTSAIPIGKIAQEVSYPERVVGTHFWNPPHLVRLVEVVQATTTSMDVINTTVALLEHASMKAVHVKRDIPGFIGNRLQHALKREAIAMVSAGVCDAETIDIVVKHSFGERLAVLGPLEQSDLVGLELTQNIYETLFPTLDNTNTVPKLLADKVKKGELGMKTGRGFRDWTPEQADEVRTNLRDFLVEKAKARLKNSK